MKATRWWMLAALPFALAACGDADDDAMDDGDVMVDSSTMTVPPVSEPAPSAMGGAVALNAVGESGVTGEAQLMDQGGTQTSVNVTLNGPADASGSHAGHVHEGTCDALGAVMAPLQNVEMANGTGMSSSTVDIPLATVMNGQHVIAFHEAGGSPGAPVVCGAIPAGAM